MPEEKSLTKKDLLDVLHDFWSDVAVPEFRKVRKEISGLRDELKAEIKENRRHISDLKADTVSRKEFDQLKNRVDSYHPSN